MKLKTVTEGLDTLRQYRNLAKFGPGEYDDYKYGDPTAAASDLAEVIDEVRIAISKARKLAGDAIGPAVIAAFAEDLIATLVRGDVARSAMRSGKIRASLQ